MGRYVRKSIKSSFRGKMKLGGAVIVPGQKEWNSPSDPFTFREFNKYPDKYIDKFMNYYGIPDSAIDRRYLKREGEQGVSYENGRMRDGLQDIDVGGKVLYDEDSITFVSEFVSGHYQVDEALSTGNYKLTFKTGEAQVLKTTRPINYHLTADEVQYIVDNDIGTGLFKVSTFGDLNHPNYGPYTFNGQQNGETGFLNIIDQSNPSVISGAITGHAGLSNCPTTQILSFYNTGNQINTVPFFMTGMIESDVYDAVLYFSRKDLQTNTFIDEYPLAVPPFSGAGDSITGEISWISNHDCISWPRFIELRKFINNVEFLISGDNAGDMYNNLSYNDNFNAYVTGYREENFPMRLHGFEFNTSEPPITLKCGKSYNEEGYWYLGAPNYFTGNKNFTFDEIHITGNTSLKSFYIGREVPASIATCKHIDLSKNENLGWFYTRDPISFLKLETLNLSGCAISGNNTPMTGFYDSVKYFPDLPSGLLVEGDKIQAIAAPVLRYANLEGNNLNRTGVLNWVNTCVYSQYAPNLINTLKISGYLNIKNQSDPSSTFAGFGNNLIDDYVLSGIECLSGKGWIVEFDGYS
tara:strand:+ start:14069 stop:15808 length:1740 start_codon:yes stop_codon:yes gene_type:complete